MALMLNAVPKIPKPENCPFIGFEKNTDSRKQLEIELDNLRKADMANNAIPIWVNGPVDTKTVNWCLIPHNFSRVLGLYCTAKEEHVHLAIKTVLAAKERWSRIPWFVRCHIFRRAARLIETKYLYKLTAAVMEDYSKNPFEAFIDVQELIDFLNFNTFYASTIYAEQPDSDRDTSNLIDYLPHEGFIFSISPNNFIAINGNLCTAPLIMGNVVIAKPSSDIVYSFSLFLRILHEAGLPADVLSVLYGKSKMISDIILDSPMLSGIHFTGSTDTFNRLWQYVGQNIGKYKNYPKIAGETGGKDFIVVYDDYDPVQTAIAITVGSFGYQGRKCSATSRVYMTPEMFGKIKAPLVESLMKIKTGDVTDFQNFMGAIINCNEFTKICDYINRARTKIGQEIQEIIEGQEPVGAGWFLKPTAIVTNDPEYETMREEVFGPVVTICLVPKDKFESGEILKICDQTSSFALTGAVHTNYIYDLCEAMDQLKFAAGNMYDDRTTAAVVNRQPFSGGRKSGTNSKVGWRLNLYNWINPRTICLRNIKTSFPPKYLE